MVSPFLLKDVLDDEANLQARDQAPDRAGGGNEVAIAVVTSVFQRLADLHSPTSSVSGVMHDLRAGVYRRLQRIVAGVLHPHRGPARFSRGSPTTSAVLDSVVTTTATTIAQNATTVDRGGLSPCACWTGGGFQCVSSRCSCG